MSGPKLGPSPTYLGFTRDRTPKLRLASIAPQGDGLRYQPPYLVAQTRKRGNVRVVRQGEKKSPAQRRGEI